MRLTGSSPTTCPTTTHQYRRSPVRKLATAAIGVLAGAAALAAPAGAAKPEPFVVTCGGVEYPITSGNGKWSVGSDTESSRHFIPKAFSFTVTDEDGKTVFSDSIEKKGHRNQETITCTFGETFVEDGQTLTFSGTATVVQRP